MTRAELSSLALFGGRPAFDAPLHVGRPNLGDRQRLLERIGEVLDRRWLTNDGPLVREFESRVAELCDVRHCIAMCNGTVALEIMVRAAGIDGEVIVPSFTFVATAHSLQWQGITPIFCDVDPRTHNLDPAQVERLVTPRTSAVLAVHLWGRGCDVEGLERVAERHGLELLFDASHAFLCTHGGRPIGGFGRAESFSFHATKLVNCFEGGAITTNDDELAARIRWMRNFGFSGRDDVRYIGSNGKMSEVSAAMGLTGIESAEDFLAANRENFEFYRERLAGVPGVELAQYAAGERNSLHYVVAEVDADAAGLTRDELQTVLEAENVLVRRYFYPGVHRMEPYRSFQPNAGLLLPQTERLVERAIQFPTGSAVSPADVERIANVVEVACRNAPEVRDRLTRTASGPRHDLRGTRP